MNIRNKMYRFLREHEGDDVANSWWRLTQHQKTFTDYSVSRNLQTSFTWSQSPEGLNFWQCLFHKYHKAKLPKHQITQSYIV